MKTLEKKGKTSQKTKELPESAKTKEVKKTKEMKDRAVQA